MSKCVALQVPYAKPPTRTCDTKNNDIYGLSYYVCKGDLRQLPLPNFLENLCGGGVGVDVAWELGRDRGAWAQKVA